MTQRVFIAFLLAALCACSSDDDTVGAGDSGAGGSGGTGDGTKHSGTGGTTAVMTGSGGTHMGAGSGGMAAGHSMADAGKAHDGGALDAGAQGASIDCGPDAAPNPIDDPSSFAGMHVDAIVYDCTQVTNCNAERGADTSSTSLPACACQEASILVDAQRQTSFLAKYTHCQQFVSCDYVTCVQMSGAGR